jgi:hypothetical protein
MNIFEWIAEQKIRKALEDGSFEGLSGFGKPLDMKANPFEPEDQRLAFHILKNNGYSLPWLDRKAEIDRTLEAFRANLRSCLAQAGKDKPDRTLLGKFAWEMAKINRLIIDYNLSVPLDSLQRPLVDLEVEMRSASRTTAD